ncbi:hypothetical protein LTR78_001864 [Recurvomyces mirabilis]|uniref:Nitrogen regulatory protein areA GATA-like domain-containing protein n=1 Tax=Recurvomyces mirabilis TaxID=574656 RepID=A0AAE0WUP9_9PEZI|nr:hypothetical protein LTR78_001864 [Recurvomyces mirabilis]KAK5156696.1 hypothetical protein LTS14_004908 [Recurvomyces mirabilis]
MPFRPEHSLLRVEVPALQTIDTGSVENLFGMWSLFSKTSHAMEHGKRLENLSWRLWNRETFCCAPEVQARSTRCSFKPTKAAATSIPMPALSSSLDSAMSDELEDAETSSAPATCIPTARPDLRRNDSACSTSRGREKHITPVDLEKIVLSIKEARQLSPIDLPIAKPASKPSAPLAAHAAQKAPPPQPTIIASRPRCEKSEPPLPKIEESQLTIESSTSTVDSNASSSTEMQIVGSESSSNTEMSTHSIVRGFVPGGAPSSYRSQTHLPVHVQPTPILKNSPSYRHSEVPKKKKGPMFTIGTSSGEDESSLETRYRSSLSESLRRPDGSDGSAGSKKQTTFKEEVAIGRAAEHSPVFESDDEDDEVSESAIDDDDDSSDWEDSDDQSGPSSVNEKELVFHRVDSRPNLTSRRSMLTTLMTEPDRAKALQNAASRSTPALRRSRTSTPNGPSVATSPEPNGHLMLPGQGPPQTQNDRTQPIIMTTSNTHPQQLALSPRTTRRNMLSTELTESLRKNLLWERQHRSTGNLAALQRRHTAQDMTKLRQQPEAVAMSQGEHTKNFTNEYFHAGLQEYHAKGW